MALKYSCDGCGKVYESDVPIAFGQQPMLPSPWASLVIQLPARGPAVIPPKQYNVCSAGCTNKILGQLKEELCAAFEKA